MLVLYCHIFISLILIIFHIHWHGWIQWIHSHHVISCFGSSSFALKHNLSPISTFPLVKTSFSANLLALHYALPLLNLLVLVPHTAMFDTVFIIFLWVLLTSVLEQWLKKGKAWVQYRSTGPVRILSRVQFSTVFVHVTASQRVQCYCALDPSHSINPN